MSIFIGFLEAAIGFVPIITLLVRWNEPMEFDERVFLFALSIVGCGFIGLGLQMIVLW